MSTDLYDPCAECGEPRWMHSNASFLKPNCVGFVEPGNPEVQDQVSALLDRLNPFVRTPADADTKARMAEIIDSCLQEGIRCGKCVESATVIHQQWEDGQLVLYPRCDNHTDDPLESESRNADQD